jgi:hypothetical protein
MDNLLIFLASSTGQLVCQILIAFGVFDMVLGQIFLGRSVIKMEKSINPGMSPQEKETVLKNIQKTQEARTYIILLACVMIVFGIFGLTR